MLQATRRCQRRAVGGWGRWGEASSSTRLLRFIAKLVRCIVPGHVNSPTYADREISEVIIPKRRNCLSPPERQPYLLVVQCAGSPVAKLVPHTVGRHKSEGSERQPAGREAPSAGAE